MVIMKFKIIILRAVLNVIINVRHASIKGTIAFHAKKIHKEHLSILMIKVYANAILDIEIFKIIRFVVITDVAIV